MTKLSYQLIMKGAWNVARKGAKRFGGKATDYLSGALKTAWKIYKRQKSRFDNDVAGIAPWFIKKTLNIDVRNINQDSRLKIVRETAKAVLINCEIYTIDRKNLLDRMQFWAPKSVVF